MMYKARKRAWMAGQAKVVAIYDRAFWRASVILRPKRKRSTKNLANLILQSDVFFE